MSKVKGRYVATVILDIEYDEDMEFSLTLDELGEVLKDGAFTRKLEELIKSEYIDADMMTLKVEQQYADLYRVDEEGAV